jgi:AraC-like DNA-binding protein
MISTGYSDKLYPAAQLGPLVALLREAAATSVSGAIAASELRLEDVDSLSTLVSVDQILAFYKAIIAEKPARGFAYRAGRRFHVTTFGMYGFAILSSKTYRRALEIALQYHQLSTPTVHASFQVDGPFAIWRVDPIPHRDMFGALYEFVVELHIGIFIALSLDVMGREFREVAIGTTFDPCPDTVREIDPLKVARFERADDNRISFDAEYLDQPTMMGSPAVNRMLLEICDSEIEQLHKRQGLAGEVRAALITNGCRTMGHESLARRLNMTERSLRRRLRAEGTSFRQLHEELQMQAAIGYLRDTAITVEAIAENLGYSDTANFRRAFRRWTGQTPQACRDGTVTCGRPMARRGGVRPTLGDGSVRAKNSRPLNRAR